MGQTQKLHLVGDRDENGHSQMILQVRGQTYMKPDLAPLNDRCTGGQPNSTCFPSCTQSDTALILTFRLSTAVNPQRPTDTHRLEPTSHKKTCLCEAAGQMDRSRRHAKCRKSAAPRDARAQTAHDASACACNGAKTCAI